MLEETPLRRATASDAPALTALINSAYRGEVSKQGWTTEADLVGGTRMAVEALIPMIAHPDHAFLIFEREGQVVASVFLQRREGRAYLGLFSVSPREQSRGWGKRLLAAAEQFVAREWKLPRIEMTVIRQRPELIAWYARRGYSDTGRREAFEVDDERFGVPLVPGLEFVLLEKVLPLK